jgi:hypothetical protein
MLNLKRAGPLIRVGMTAARALYHGKRIVYLTQKEQPRFGYQMPFEVVNSKILRAKSDCVTFPSTRFFNLAPQSIGIFHLV